jgi:predicted ATPase
MNGARFIHQLKIKNFLSYGSNEQIIDLQPLNVIIGSNASGKSNLIEVIGFLQASPTNLMQPIREGGGAREWFWKGNGKISPIAKIEALINYPANYPDATMRMRYHLEIALVKERLEIIDEAIENEKKNHPSEEDVYFYYRYQHGSPVINTRIINTEEGGGSRQSSRSTKSVPTAHQDDRINNDYRNLTRESLKPDQSVLSQRKDPELYPELTYVANQFAEIKLYREWIFGRYNASRQPQKIDLPEDFLLEDASNLGLIINKLENDYNTAYQKLIEEMQVFYALAERISTRLSGGTVQIYLHEKGLSKPIPGTRLSDGTLRYLCLLTLLLHPDPPPLICLEEPELGLHSDVLPALARLLIDASQRTQLIVTTHSDALISALSEVPESVMICERDEMGSYLNRIDPNDVQTLLENHTLGELWRMGELGGNRW